MNISVLLYILTAVLFSASSSMAQPGNLKEKLTIRTLWQKGSGQYNNYRIPSLIVTRKGTVLAFCEGREGGDAGDINLLVKRSEDNGKSWEQERVIWDDGKNTCGNPCPVVDEKTGRIWLLMTWNHGEDKETEIVRKTARSPRSPYIAYSDDDGLSWSEPEKLPDHCRDPSWGWYATGPGIGIQLKEGRYKGRLVIPANHSYDDPEGNIRNGPYGYGAHVLYSDDHGETWNRSRSIRPGCNESQIAESSDGTLIMNMRSYNDQFSRAISYSTDGGETWTGIEHDLQLVESKCQASLLNYGAYGNEHMYLFSNPGVPVGRTHMTLRASFDDCRHWTNSKLIYPGPSAYSCLTKLPDGKIGLFFEAGRENRYEKMVFISFDPGEIFRPGPLILPEDL